MLGICFLMFNKHTKIKSEEEEFFYNIIVGYLVGINGRRIGRLECAENLQNQVSTYLPTYCILYGILHAHTQVRMRLLLCLQRHQVSSSKTYYLFLNPYDVASIPRSFLLLLYFIFHVI